MTYITAILLSLGVIGAYAILAIGIIMIYRASKVLNLAHGAMAMVPPYVVYALDRAGVPLFASLPLGIVAGGVLGWSVERFFIRPLRREGPTAQTVGTVAALGILIAVVAKIFGTTGLPAVRVFPEGHVQIDVSSIRYGEFGLFGVMLLVTGALILLFQRTDLGLMMRGTAENRRAASLMGVDPDRITGLAWIMGGALAGLSGILLASLTQLHPYVLSLQALPAFVAALIGGLASVQGGVAGAVVVGASIGIVSTLPVVKDWQGGRQLFLAIVAIVVMALRGRRIEAGDVRGEAATAAPARAERVRLLVDPGTAARRRRLWLVGGGIVFLAFPWVPLKSWFSVLGGANDAARFTLIATSLVVLVGWVGQISLGHAALVGVGGYLTGAAATGLGIPFPLNLPIAVIGSAAIAAILGTVAVRVRGLYLAVATLIFSWMADEFLFRQGWLLKYGQIKERSIGGGVFPYFDFTERKVFYFIAWSVAIAGLIAAANLRDSKTGRAFFAVRGSEMAAASLGIDVVRTKLVAFALSGALAGAAGSLVMAGQRVVNPEEFTFGKSFFFLSIAVVGGLQSLGGGVAAAVLFASLSVLFYKVQALAGLLDIVSSGLLAVVLLTYREGLAAVPRSLEPLLPPLTKLGRGLARPVRAPASAIARAAARATRVPRRVVTAPFTRFRPRPSANGNGDRAPERAPVEAPVRSLPPDRDDRRALIEVRGLTVRFGGLTAVGDVSMKVCEGEIVGLIGPNGAGKTVTFNAVSGLVTPTQGRVFLDLKDVTNVPVHVRAQMGLARTFQVIQLFGRLTVFDNLLVATHVHNSTGLLEHVLATGRSISAELDSRRRVADVIARLNLASFADRRVADLPFGVLRMVEVARALVTGHSLIMLDEAASGLDNAETDRLSDLLRFVRDMGVTLLLIEHDVQMVTSLSDYIYVLDRGALIAEGRPEEIRRNPAVIAAYLGDSDAVPVEA
jgi:ABC-type branched-subunit amino acid transport system ATPase component/branched-subunit amino acid ABC-type transport system permease component